MLDAWLLARLWVGALRCTTVRQVCRWRVDLLPDPLPWLQRNTRSVQGDQHQQTARQRGLTCTIQRAPMPSVPPQSAIDCPS